MDKLVGPKVRISINKFLPTIFVDAMKQSPEVNFHCFNVKGTVKEKWKGVKAES